MIKWLLSGLMLVMLARAQAEARVLRSLSPRPAGADFRGDSTPIDVRRMADWVVASADNDGLPFIIVDKIDAEVSVFDRQGQILGSAPALLGLGVGDDSAAWRRKQTLVSHTGQGPHNAGRALRRLHGS